MNTKEYMAQYRAIHRDKFKEYSRRFYAKNKASLRAKHHQHYAANAGHYRLRHRKNHIAAKYGITLERFNELLTAQDNLCAICQAEFGWTACVDHDHATGKVRGLLCRKCNLNLHAIEDGDYLKKARRYLQASEAKDKEPLR